MLGVSVCSVMVLRYLSAAIGRTNDDKLTLCCD